MRKLIAVCLGLLCLASLAACSRSVQPPAGRWEGTYNVDGTLVAARLEITPRGLILLSAPNAENMGSLSDEDRAVVRQKLSDDLEESWNSVQSRQMDFDGKTFRKPGGIAPQAEWDASTHQMTLIVYLSKGDGIRIPMRAIKNFSPDPWAGA